MLMSFQIKNCYDSHVHWEMTGQKASMLSLSQLTSQEDILNLSIRSENWQGDWLVGFGWDHNLWHSPALPDRKVLDLRFPSQPVAFSRSDGHALWVNTQALKQAGLWSKNTSDPKGGRIIRDSEGMPTGILVDLAMQSVKSLIPGPTRNKLRANLLAGQDYFHTRGFTHIRDLTGPRNQWEEVVKLCEEKLLLLAVEQYFDAENPDDFDQALKLACEAKAFDLALVRAKGIKIYADGALGSEGAYLSCPYCSGSGRGLKLLDDKMLQEMMIRTWKSDLCLAVHVIGDEAAHQVASIAHKLWEQGHRGLLQLEHAQMMRKETIQLLTGQNVECYMQPCHWLSDKRWLKQKIGSLMDYVFPWQALERAKIPIYFGSDTPIEEASVFNTLLALEDSKKAGIAPLCSDALSYHRYPDISWTPNTYTTFEHQSVSEVFFLGEKIFKKFVD